MERRRFMFANGMPLWEFIVTLFITMFTVLYSKVVASGSSVFNFIPFILITVIAWLYLLLRLYIFIRLYVSEELFSGEILSISDSAIKVRYIDYSNIGHIITIMNVSSKYSALLRKGMQVRIKRYRHIVEILETNKLYNAYKNYAEFPDYLIVERLCMKIFKALEMRGLV